MYVEKERRWTPEGSSELFINSERYIFVKNKMMKETFLKNARRAFLVSAVENIKKPFGH